MHVSNVIERQIAINIVMYFIEVVQKHYKSYSSSSSLSARFFLANCITHTTHTKAHTNRTRHTSDTQNQTCSRHHKATAAVHCCAIGTDCYLGSFMCFIDVFYHLL